MLLRQPEVEAARKLEHGRVIDISATVLIGSQVRSSRNRAAAGRHPGARAALFDRDNRPFRQ
jgi:hypothetical protein